MEFTYIHHNGEVLGRTELLLTNGNEHKPYAKIMLSQQLSPVHVIKPQDSPRITLYHFNNWYKFCRTDIIVLPSEVTAFRAQTKNDKEEVMTMRGK